MTADRRLRDGEFPLKGLLLAWAAVCLILLVTGIGRVLAGRFPDPDDVLRLVQVRDLLAGQGWFDATQYRIDPPQGTVMHWSRLVDIPLLLVIGALTPLAGQAAAETVALVLVPFLTFAIAAAALGRLAWRLLGNRAAIFAVLACGFLPSLLFQFQPMRIDHHGWQVASVAVALWAISRRQATFSGWVAGIAMAFGTSISLEVLPLAAAFAAVLWVRWWFDYKQRDWLVAYMLGLSLGMLGFYLVTRGASTIAYCDAISPAHIAFFLVAAAGTWIIANATKLRGFGLVMLFALVGALAVGAFALISPTCLGTPFAALDPLVDRYWYRLVLEGQPLWKQPPATWVPALVQLLAAIGAVIALHLRSMEWMRGWWGEYLFLLLAATALGLLVARSLAFASIIAAIPLGWLASRLLLRIRQQKAPLASLGLAAIIIVLLAPMSLVMAARALMPAEETEVQNVASGACDIYGNAPLLAKLETGTVIAPLDLGPAILLDTEHSVVATGHHRAAEAMGDVIRTFTSPAGKAREIAKAHNADYLALCTDMTEAALYAHEAPDGLAATLTGGEVPDWLEREDLGGPEEFAVYRVAD
ncbi:hypothetical protein K3152_10285 [Qipengyuania sp. 1NDH17]|uniref:AcrB/AcrD/AcrF family protein n=1 Tax=Qipengyuania polymorpha TaxID=2867234 RepID=A0ABS7J5D8_9SPHN|nr:hypothetical protein [Qipengyuania polymorpha]MBX7458633.1 hypothetical protein [Qipengyuania polymorpha]